MRKLGSQIRARAPRSTVGRAAGAAHDATGSIAGRSTKLATAPRKNAVARWRHLAQQMRGARGEPPAGSPHDPRAAWVLDGLAAGPAPALAPQPPY
jgi:hypothetical protein